MCCSVECLYPSNSYLMVDFSAVVIAPGASVNAIFSFYPRQCIKYNELVNFQINGLSCQEVQITGEGTELRVRLPVLTSFIVYLFDRVSRVISLSQPPDPEHYL